MRLFPWRSISLVLYMLACVLPVFSVQAEEAAAMFSPSIAGWECLFFGALSGVRGVVAWSANIAWLVCVTNIENRKRLAFLAWVLAITLPIAGLGLVGGALRVGPGGALETITGIGPGYYVWWAALILPGGRLLPRRK